MAAANRLPSVEDLREAVRRNVFVLFYQRVVSLATGETTGAEASLHWPQRRPALRFLAGARPLTEDSDLILRLGARALALAAQAAASWAIPLPVTVDVSPHQLAGGALIRQVAVALEEAGLPPERLALTVTQSVPLAAVDDVVLTLAALRDQGISIALGDFGVGGTTLTTLKNLPISALKLHRSLLTGVPQKPVDAGMLRAAVAAGRALGVSVIADGVETETQRDFLAKSGVDQGQGFLFGRAAPADEVAAA